MGAKSQVGFGDEPENCLMHSRKPDFSGWATKAGMKCSDGRTILPGAFKHQDKATVPMVWQHGHNDPVNVLGHTVLEDRKEGVYAYGYFNDTAQATNAKTLVQHKDITALSIFANQLVEKAKNVTHGVIREVSLVLAGANPGALIDNIELQHADGELVKIDDEAVIYTGLTLKHEDDEEEKPDESEEKEEKEESEESEENEEVSEDDPTVQVVYDSMTDEQKEVVHFMVGAALDGSATDTEVSHSDEEDETDEEKDTTVKRNVFEQQGKKSGEEVKHELSHDALEGIKMDAVRTGSLKEAVENYALEHDSDRHDREQA